MSGMGLSIPTNKLDYVVTELIRVTKPGGWIEIAENDLELANLGMYSERIIKEGELDEKRRIKGSMQAECVVEHAIYSLLILYFLLSQYSLEPFNTILGPITISTH